MNPAVAESCLYEGAGLWSFLCTEKDQISSLAAIVTGWFTVLGAFLTILGLLLSIITAVTAVAGTWLAIKNLMSIKEDSEAQTRPYIYASLALGVQLNGSVDLVVENQGKTPAQNIRFYLEDPSSAKSNEHICIKPYDYIWPRLKEVMFSNAFYLPPQGKIRWMWASIYINTDENGKKHLDEEKKLVETTPPAGRTTNGIVQASILRVTYQSSPGVFKKTQVYEEVFPLLDADTFTSLAPMPAEGTERSKDNNRIMTEKDYLFEINQALRTQNIHTGLGNY
ncbi:hypothetical protein AB0O14_18905 [Microbacterium foliorum]|uniref:hypothetical protein n=1 Tax=Rothia terrae TaxID=396015 RepID=UPI00342EF3BA